MELYREEYPRPQFVRQDWMNLNGTWEFCFDDDNVGHREKWYEGHDFDLTIQVPFCYQSKLSGIHDPSFHDHVWYRRKFTVDPKYRDKRVILHIGACDYESEVYINHKLVTRHIGGHIGFSVDITDYLTFEEEEIVIYAYDPSTDEYIPRGKQYWKEEIEGIWYTRTTGIWQTVWLEFVNDVRIDRVRMTPDLDRGALEVEVTLSENFKGTLGVKVFDQGNLHTALTINTNKYNRFTIDVFKDEIFNTNTHNHGKTWSPENPYLFDIEFELYDGEHQIDHVKSYFGMRKIEQKNGQIYLNNRPYYQKLVLHQGYYEQGLLTAPSDEDFIRDIELSKQMGFNGCRRHQHVSDPRFLYHADRLGFLVWGEMPSCVSFNEDAVERMVQEWIQVINRDYNHPSIIVWVPLNESWGVSQIQHNLKQQYHSLNLYYLTKSLDHTRLVISNDGWEMTKTDICAIHNYRHGAVDDREQHQWYEWSLATLDNILQSTPADRVIYVDGFRHEGEPVMLTEFGGISYAVDRKDGWGYSAVQDEETFLKEYERLIRAIKQSDCIVGYCYTQLTDVFQEINGLLTFDRQPKADVSKIKAINDLIK